jgi:hypothetical protein
VSATFDVREARVSEGGKRVVKVVEHVRVEVGHEVVHRVATDEDRLRFKTEYLAFNPGAKDRPPFRTPESLAAEEAEKAEAAASKSGPLSRKK